MGVISLNLLDISGIWLILFIVLIVIIYKIVNEIRNKRITKANNEKETRLREDVVLDSKIKLLFDSLGQPYNDFILDDEDIFYFVNNQYNYNAISFVIHKIMAHLKMPYTYFDIKIFVDDEENNINPGSYSNISGKPTIIIRLKKTYSYEQIIAVLCHECMHHFLFNKNIKIEPETENEILTDVATIYFGFYLYMNQGYQEKIQETTVLNTIKKETTKIGYIDIFQIDYVYSIVKELKRGICFEDIHKSEAERENEKASREFQKILKKECKILYEVISRNQEVVSIIIENKNADVMREDFELLQRNIINIENKTYMAKYIELNRTTENNNYITEKEYKRVKKDIYDFSTELALMTSVLGKYL